MKGAQRTFVCASSINHFIINSMSFLKKHAHNAAHFVRTKRTFVYVAVVSLCVGLAAGYLVFFLAIPAWGRLSIDAIKTQASNFITANLAGGRSFTISSVSDESGVYKIAVALQGNSLPIYSYVTKDGAVFFPQGMPMNASSTQAAAAAPGPSATVAKKEAKPTVDLYVMSLCPFGTQMERGLIPVLETLGNAVDFHLKFVDYMLHGKNELTENERQYCITQNEPEKVVSYLKCFDTSEDAAACMAANGIASGPTDTCMQGVQQKYGLDQLFAQGTENNTPPSFPIYHDENVEYGVQGSPTLVVNGTQIAPNRDSASLLKAICSAFTTEPAACTANLSSSTPSTGFGDGSAAAPASGAPAAANSSCGS